MNGPTGIQLILIGVGAFILMGGYAKAFELLTTEATIVEKPEKEGPAPMMPPGGMGGGMDMY